MTKEWKRITRLAAFAEYKVETKQKGLEQDTSQEKNGIGT